MHEPVAITGMGMVTSLGPTPENVWDALFAGKSGIGTIRGFDASGFGHALAAQVSNLDAISLGISHREARIMDVPAYMLMKSCRDAYHHAELNSSMIPGDEIGFFAGMGMVDYNESDLLPAVQLSRADTDGINYDSFYSRGFRDIFPLWPLSMLNNISFCQVAITLGIRGENIVFSPHADSGMLALIEGLHTIREGRARFVLAGGVSEKITASSLARAHLTGLSNSETVSCRPLGFGRNGTILGEGSGIITLEPLTAALQRSAHCLAVVAGYGFSFGTDYGAPGGMVGAIRQAMTDALLNAGREPHDIDLIIAHGDGTPEGDAAEITAINDVFQGLERSAVYAGKGALGNTLAASPAIDTILAVLMLNNSTILPLTPSFRPDEAIRFTLISCQPENKDMRRILINCRSNEGQAASLLLEAAGEGV